MKPVYIDGLDKQMLAMRCRTTALAFLAWASLAAAPPQPATRVIAAFDGQRLESETGLAIWPYADEQLGGTSVARVTLIHPGADRSRGAMRVSLHVTNDFPTPFAGAWAMVGPEGLATDLSAYDGVRFFARSRERTTFRAGIVRFPGQLKRYVAPFEAGPEWTMVDLPFAAFKVVPPPGGPADDSPLDPKDITSIGVTTGLQQIGEFELDIDHIELYALHR